MPDLRCESGLALCFEPCGIGRETADGLLLVGSRVTSVKDRHASRETEIFRRFARASGLAIDESSVQKRPPPEPDILCLSETGEQIAFELVELIDRSFARRTWSQLKLKARFESSYAALDSSRKCAVEQRVGNALIHVVFDEEASHRSREEAIAPTLEVLGRLDASFDGVLRRRDGAELPGGVREVRVARLQSRGPFFDIDSVGSFGDPTLPAIRQKWTKAYSSPFSIDLLAYYELQPELPEAFWRPRLVSFIQGNAASSPFRRVWVYDCGAQAVRFSSEYLGVTERGG
jgi:hypothetical protein